MAQPSAGFEGRAAWRLHHLPSRASSFLADALHGLAQPHKRIPPKYFYDERGSQLFEMICDLPEYYLTRAELSLMHARLDAMRRALGSGMRLIEFGSGASIKSRLLIEALRPAAYLPIDISPAALHSAGEGLQADYPWLHIDAVVADFSEALRLPATLTVQQLPQLLYFPGSTIGNFDRDEALALLRNMHELAGPRGLLLIGVDLKKDRATLEAAYNDAQGVTAEFNLNLLARMNRELSADFDLGRFEHYAFYDEAAGRIEMHLRSLRAQRVAVAGRVFEFGEGESLHTEISCKYGIAEFQHLAGLARFQPVEVWTDEAGLFSVHLLRAV